MKTASQEEITEFAGRINACWINSMTCDTLEDAAELIESKLDGTQPKNLISEALILAQNWVKQTAESRKQKAESKKK